jgi:hypothetical protein
MVQKLKFELYNIDAAIEECLLLVCVCVVGGIVIFLLCVKAYKTEMIIIVHIEINDR